MGKGIFITGTDTGVGKTIVTAILVRALKLKGYDVGVMKPIETGGFREGHTILTRDCLFLKEIAEVEESIRVITPYPLENPLAPSVAASIEGIVIEVDRIIEAFNVLSARHDIVVVEGVGGLLVPVYKRYLLINLISDLGLPIIVVVRPTLGTINHSLLTINYAKKDGLSVLGFVINYSQPYEQGIAEKTSPAVIEEMSNVPLLGTIPYLNEITKDSLDRAAIKYLDLRALALS